MPVIVHRFDIRSAIVFNIRMATITNRKGNAMTTTFDTNEFRRAHGTTPRGHGWWMFRNNETGATFTHAGTFTAARAACAATWPGATVTVMS